MTGLDAAIGAPPPLGGNHAAGRGGLGPRDWLDTTDPAFLANPHPVFDALRERGDGFVDDGLGVSLLGYSTCAAAFHDPHLVPGIDHLLGQMGYGPLWGTFGRTLTDSEGFDHQRLRRAVSPWFTARRIDAIRLRTRALVDQLLDAHDPDQPLEVMAELADRVPAEVFCWMVGADPADAAMLARLSKALLLVFTAEPSMVEPVRNAKRELLDYTGELLRHKRRRPSDDLASVLVDAQQTGAISGEDALHLLEELLSASVDNTANTTGLAVYTVATHPDQWLLLHRDPATIGAATEECGRYQPAIRHTIKYVTNDTTLPGTSGQPRRLAAGSFATIRIAAAHRDPAVFADPHRFDVNRKLAEPQLAFGAGRHYCLGAALGKMEIQEMVAGLVNRWPAATVCEGAEMTITSSGHVQRLPLQLHR